VAGGVLQDPNGVKAVDITLQLVLLPVACQEGGIVPDIFDVHYILRQGLRGALVFDGSIGKFQAVAVIRLRQAVVVMADGVVLELPMNMVDGVLKHGNDGIVDQLLHGLIDLELLLIIADGQIDIALDPVGLLDETAEFIDQAMLGQTGAELLQNLGNHILSKGPVLVPECNIVLFRIVFPARLAGDMPSVEQFPFLLVKAGFHPGKEASILIITDDFRNWKDKHSPTSSQ